MNLEIPNEDTFVRFVESGLYNDKLKQLSSSVFSYSDAEMKQFKKSHSKKNNTPIGLSGFWLEKNDGNNENDRMSAIKNTCKIIKLSENEPDEAFLFIKVANIRTTKIKNKYELNVIHYSNNPKNPSHSLVVINTIPNPTDLHLLKNLKNSVEKVILFKPT